MKKDFLRIMLVLLLIVAFGYFIYPTPYYYTHFVWNDNSYPVKINRFTGEAHSLSVDGWHEMKENK